MVSLVRLLTTGSFPSQSELNALSRSTKRPLDLQCNLGYQCDRPHIISRLPPKLTASFCVVLNAMQLRWGVSCCRSGPLLGGCDRAGGTAHPLCTCTCPPSALAVPADDGPPTVMTGSCLSNDVQNRRAHWVLWHSPLRARAWPNTQLRQRPRTIAPVPATTEGRRFWRTQPSSFVRCCTTVGLAACS